MKKLATSLPGAVVVSDGSDGDGTKNGPGGDIVVPTASNAGEFCAGLDIIDEMTFGAGYRYFPAVAPHDVFQRDLPA